MLDSKAKGLDKFICALKQAQWDSSVLPVACSLIFIFMLKIFKSGEYGSELPQMYFLKLALLSISALLMLHAIVLLVKSIAVAYKKDS